MDKRVKRTILICDTDLDHSFTLEGELKNHGYDVVNITEATELVASAKSLQPSAILANPDIQGFNEYDVCKKLIRDLNIPVVLMLDRNSTRRAQIGDCPAADVITKPAEAGNLVTLIKKHISLQQQ
jgi:DNA-binding response OmpR family regulator